MSNSQQISSQTVDCANGPGEMNTSADSAADMEKATRNSVQEEPQSVNAAPDSTAALASNDQEVQVNTSNGYTSNEDDATTAPNESDLLKLPPHLRSPIYHLLLPTIISTIDLTSQTLTQKHCKSCSSSMHSRSWTYSSSSLFPAR